MENPSDLTEIQAERSNIFTNTDSNDSEMYLLSSDEASAFKMYRFFINLHSLAFVLVKKNKNRKRTFKDYLIVHKTRMSKVLK